MSFTETKVVDRRKELVEAAYKEVFTHFMEKLAEDSSPYAKFKLQLTANHLDDNDLSKRVHGIWSGGELTPAQKQAIARTALFDALVANVRREAKKAKTTPEA